MSDTFSALCINDLKLSVNLGWTARERTKKQIVWLNIKISFSNSPKACTTDELDDTLCYDTLIADIQKKIAGQQFHLIEFLTQQIYLMIKALLPQKTTLIITIRKHPNIKGLTGGVCFSYGDN